MRLHAACAPLLHHLRASQAQAAVALLAAAHGAAAAGDALAAAGAVLRGAADFMQDAASLRVSARLALLPAALCPPPASKPTKTSDGGDSGDNRAISAATSGASSSCASTTSCCANAGDHAEAVLIELPLSSGCGGAPASGAGSAAGVAASAMGLEGTLLASALAKQQARFVKDATAYMQVRGPSLWRAGRADRAASGAALVQRSCLV